MTPAEIHATARERIANFLASLDREPSPPHRVQTGRAAPDLERDLAAEASRVWHEPVKRVGPSRDRVREAERRLEPRPTGRPLKRRSAA